MGDIPLYIVLTGIYARHVPVNKPKNITLCIGTFCVYFCSKAV